MQAHPRQDAEVAARAAALGTALEAGSELLDPEAVAVARETLERTEHRLRLGAEHIVVALVGATGSGKSSLFNALAGMEIAEVGARRPMTSLPMACVWGDGDADPLLDWIGIEQQRRFRRESVLDADRQAPLHGLVLLDLPDHDSIEVAHRLEVDRLVELVDLLIWVVDPQKYADEALHSGYLQRLSGHDGVMVVVLNQIDRLGPAEADTCRRDLRRLLDGDGLESVRVLAVSATRGDGVDDLRGLLAEASQNRSAARERAAADLQAAADGLARGLAHEEPGRGSEVPGTQELIAALGDSIGIPAVAHAVASEYRRRGSIRTGWPVLRWVARLSPDALGRLGITVAQEDLRRIATSLMPAAAPSQRPQVRLAVDTYVDGVARALPPRWGRAVHEAVSQPGDDLVTTVDTAVARVDLGLTPPAWWRVVHVLQLLLALAIVAGAGWMFAVGAIQLAGQLPPETPDVAGLPLPVLLFLLGLVLGAVLAFVSARFLAAGARRRRELASGRLHAAVAGIADSRVTLRVQAVLERHRAVREALAAVDTPLPPAPEPAASPAVEPEEPAEPAGPAAAAERPAEADVRAEARDEEQAPTPTGGVRLG